MNCPVSIIVPIYKAENFIERCVRSLFEQTLLNIEYIFVDDCSPDRSMEKLRQVMTAYEHKSLTIKIVVHEQNKGSSSARNSGLAVATGEYIFYCDGDDWIEKDAMEKMYRFAQNRQADVVWCDFFFAYSTHGKVVKQKNEVVSLECIKALLSEKMHGSVCNKLVKRTLYEENNIRFCDDYNMWEDLRLSVQLFYYAKKVAYLPEAYYHYVQDNPNSLSVGLLKKRVKEMIGNADGIIEFLKDKDVQLDTHVNYLKLASKRLLLSTTDKSCFHQWKQIYSESDKYIWSYSTWPLHYRFLGWCVSCGFWFPIDIWFFLKNIKNKK